MDDAAAASSSAAPSVNSEDVNELFIKHKVSKMDTVAGLAIRYNVSVADIKRANGLLTDTAMFGRETVLIPTQQLPLGQDVQMMVAQIFSGVGRDRLLNADARMTPGSAAMAMASTSQAAAGHDTGQGDPGGDLSWLAACGGICGECFDQPPLSPSQRRAGGVAEPGDVELMDRSPKSQSAHYTAARAEELVRRRRREGEGNGEILPDPLDSSFLNGYGSRRPAAAAPFSGKGFWGNMSTLSKSFQDSAIVQRIKKVASQPALATPTASSFADAADAVLASFQRPGSAQRERPTGAAVAAMVPARKKDSGKAE